MKSFENINQKNFQGGVLVLKNGQVVFEYCQGNADYGTNTPFTSHTTITLASLSKQFIAAAIFLQIEQGNLSLDDTIEPYFPQYPQGKNITIRHLLHHSSGIPDYISDRIIPDAICKYESEHGIAPADIIEFHKCLVAECHPVSLSECFELIGELAYAYSSQMHQFIILCTKFIGATNIQPQRILIKKESPLEDS